MASANDEVVLEVQGLKKRFGAVEVLRGIDLTVTHADVFVIIGPNGCGKSTFLRCLNLLEPYQEGRVLLRGQIVSQGTPDGHRLNHGERDEARKLRQRIGMVFQQFNLFPHMNVLHNVMMGPLHVLKKPREEAAGIAREMLAKVGLADRADRNPMTLSGGQQQRVAIARTLAMRPDLVLFDEATSALDPQLTQEVLRVIKDLVQEGMTMMLITHDMDFARDVADQVIFMEQGRIQAMGTPAQIFEDCSTEAVRSFLRPR